MKAKFNISIPVVFLSKLKEDYSSTSKEFQVIEMLIKDFGWRYSSATILEVDIERLPDSILDRLIEYGKTVKGVIGNRKLVNEIESYRRVQENPEGSIVTTLQSLKVAIDKYIETTTEHYLFYKDDLTSTMTPYAVISSKYSPPYTRGDQYIPPTTHINLESTRMGEPSDTTITYYTSDIRGTNVTIRDLLKLKGYYLENEALLEAYREELQLFFKYKDMIGGQFLGKGFAYEADSSSGRWYRRNQVTSLEKDGFSYKLVIDTFPKSEVVRRTSTNLKFVGKNASTNNGESEEEGNMVLIPIQPYLRVFNLQTHTFLDVHVNSLSEYIYDTNLGEKLILPEDHKQLIDILSRGLGEEMSDIITGKTGGVIVIATGPPGTGKTLTAEVYSEVVQKPLYIVQASQLGVSLDSLEKNLLEILERSSRWSAILLIDEADVYIHERGSDIIQNAIVGVFLRVLEYYRGILFMTSNRGDIIDDAIMSRKTAHIQYTLPEPEQQREIWRVLSHEFKVALSKELIEELLVVFPNLSGRDIKNHIKLAKLLSLKLEKPMEVSLFQYIHKYLVVDKVTKN